MKLISCLLLAASSLSLAQTTTMSVLDQSAPDSPIHITGQVTLTETVNGSRLDIGRAVMINATDVSTKDIVALMVKATINGFRSNSSSPSDSPGIIAIGDYFFKPEKFGVGEVVPVIVDPYYDESEAIIEGPTKGAWPGPPTSTPQARAQVVFVQFLDGSTWGGAAEQQKFFDGRHRILNVLQNLLDTYNQQGEAAFVGLLADPGKLGPGNPSAIVHGLHHFMEQNGVAATVDRIALRVKTAHDRSYLLPGYELPPKL